MRYITIGIILSIFLLGCSQKAKQKQEVSVSLDKFSDGTHHYELFAEDLDYIRLDTNDYRGIADNLVQFQNEDGGSLL